MPPKLGILAGGGSLPRHLAQACLKAGRDCVLVALEGHADPRPIPGIRQVTLRLGAAGRIMAFLRAQGVREIVFAGKVHRPRLGALRPDWRTLRFLVGIGFRLQGDNRLMRAIVRSFESEGFRVVGAESVVADLLAPCGPLGALTPTLADEEDIAAGILAARRLGLLDRGHAVVVSGGEIIGIEDADGTDGLLEACRSRRPGSAGGGVLVKVLKPQQELRADPPVIGLETVRRAAAAELRGIAVQAQGTLIIDREAVASAADEAGLFLVGVEVRP